MIIPFFIPHAGCPHQCVFCDQRRITGEHSVPDPAAIPATIRSYLATESRSSAGRGKDQAIEVAFYGGSFTALPPVQQKSYLKEVRPFLASGEVRSIRISTRPDGISPEVLALLREHQVATVELGVQSFDDDVLRCSGRGHTAEQSVTAAGLLRDSGFSVGFQLMPGLPGDTASRFRSTIDRTCELKPDCVRLYPALVIRDTPLERLFRAGQYAPLTLDNAVAWCVDAREQFETAGISVLRIGLQPTDALCRPGTIVAGPFHPAFGQLVESALFLEKMQNLLKLCGNQTPQNFVVHPKDLSAAIGQRKSNISLLRKQFGIPRIRVLTSPDIERGKASLAIEE